MKFISSTKEMKRVLSRSIKKYKYYKWAVAWASSKAPEFVYLENNIKKNDKLVVGIHFYQTDPDFIESFVGKKNVHFILQPSGTFHPKIYLFENSNLDWCAIVGSSNYTKAAFGSNAEAVIELSSEEESRDVFDEMSSAIDKWFQEGETLSSADLKNYRRIWEKRKKLRKIITDQFDDEDSSEPLIRHPLLNLNWAKYVKRVVTEDSHHSTNMRLSVLDMAHSYFQQYNHFLSIPYELRRCIAGYARDGILDWGYFGSMVGAMQFKNKVKVSNQGLADAIDSIPLVGAIKFEHFDEYRRKLDSAFPQGGYDIAVLTRLLAMKRPDYFVSVNQQNSSGLKRELLIKGKINVNNYWSSVIERILDSNWWNSPQPADAIGIRIWRGRAAMLDALYYVPVRRKKRVKRKIS